MRRLMKFLHTMGAIGLMGAMACLLVLLAFTPAPSQLALYTQMRGAMGGIATWVLLPSLAMTLVSGLLAMAVNPGFHNAGWALVKLATGVLIFEWGFAGIVGPMQQEAEASAAALAGSGDAAGLGASLGAESGSLWVLLAIAALNVVLGVWRPRLMRRRARAASRDALATPE
ncbi:MAG: hypothetical protein Q7T73_19305 [Beijerinckiaceae bacterium]|nr:hypothetical protein [Beijerinckiaceae bacterium]